MSELDECRRSGGSVKCNPLKDKIRDWDESWNWLGRITIEYNWKYRQRVCSKCPREAQIKWDCHRINKFRLVNGKLIQETHCRKLKRARANKLRNHIKHVLALYPFCES